MDYETTLKTLEDQLLIADQGTKSRIRREIEALLSKLPPDSPALKARASRDRNSSYEDFAPEFPGGNSSCRGGNQSQGLQSVSSTGSRCSSEIAQRDPRFSAVENDFIASKRYDSRKLEPFMYKRGEPDYREGNCLESLGQNFKPKPLSDFKSNEAFLVDQIKDARKQRRQDQLRAERAEKEESRKIISEIRKDERERKEKDLQAKLKMREDLDRQIMTKTSLGIE